MERLEKELKAAIEATDLNPQQKQFMRSRWLDQVIWLERAAKRNNIIYFALHFIAIIGGATVTALASLSAIDGGNEYIRTLNVIVSLIIAISVSLEGYFVFGEQWRHYRGNVEVLLSEGWEFLGLTGKYRDFKSHSEAYKVFAGNVEDLIRSEVQAYFAKVPKEKEGEGQRDTTPKKQP